MGRQSSALDHAHTRRGCLEHPTRCPTVPAVVTWSGVERPRSAHSVAAAPSFATLATSLAAGRVGPPIGVLFLGAPANTTSVTATSVSGPRRTADQRNGRYDPLVFLAALVVGGALLLAMLFGFAPPGFLVAPFFLAAF
jgi:hypothetical protein